MGGLMARQILKASVGGIQIIHTHKIGQTFTILVPVSHAIIPYMISKAISPIKNIQFSDFYIKM
jgi:hypothetical protein